MQLITIGFDDLDEANGTLDEIEQACDDREVRLRELALTYRAGSGKPRVRQAAEVGSATALLQGGILALLVAATGPVGAQPGPRIGGALGGVIAGIGVNGLDNPVIRSLSAAIQDRTAVVVALGEDAQFCRLSDVIGPHGERATIAPVPETTRHLMREVSKLSMEDLQPG